MTTAVDIIVPKKQIFRALLQIYDVSAGGYRTAELYIHNPKSETGAWAEVMLKAQNSGSRLATSSEWYKGRQYLQKHNPKAEKDFIEGPLEWTGTVLDFDKEEVLEGITLNPDGSIADVKARLGKRQNIILPQESKYIRDLGDKYMPLVSHLWGIEKPKKELPDYAYLWISPGFRPVVRGDWGYSRDDGRVDAAAGCGAAGGGFAARFVSDAKSDALTPEEYETLARNLSNKEAELKARYEAELKPLQDELDATVVLFE